MEEPQAAQAYTLDINSLDTSAQIATLHQEGNFLVGTTDKGVTFRQSIPVGKILNKNEKGDWILQDMVVM